MFRRSFAVVCAAVLLSGGAYAEPSSPTAGERWQAIEALKKQLAADAPAGMNEVEFSAPIEARLNREASTYAADYPTDPHHWDALLLELKTVNFPAPAAERLGIFDQQEKLNATIQAGANAPDATKRDAERTVIRQHLDHLDLIDTPEKAAALEKRLTEFIQHHPTDPKAGALQLRRLDLLQKFDPKQAASLLATLASSDDPTVAAAARGRQRQQTLAENPLDWKFTAVDGTAVDLAKWRGRVVLVDFWATWCPDCLRELPEVQAAYQRYHDAGLEVVGISLDRDKSALVSFTKKRAIPWPQQFDGRGWDTEIALRYGVRGIPEMWLVDRKGRVVATGLHGSQLDEKIRTLLNL